MLSKPVGPNSDFLYIQKNFKGKVKLFIQHKMLKKDYLQRDPLMDSGTIFVPIADNKMWFMKEILIVLLAILTLNLHAQTVDSLQLLRDVKILSSDKMQGR